MEKIKRAITQTEIQELREIIECSENDREIELFKKFHEIFNKLLIFYKEKRTEKNKNFFYWKQYEKMCQEKRKWEEERKKLKEKLKKQEILYNNSLNTEITKNVELYRTLKKIEIEGEK